MSVAFAPLLGDVVVEVSDMESAPSLGLFCSVAGDETPSVLDASLDAEDRKQWHLLKILMQTLHRYFGGVHPLLGGIADPRHASYVDYPLEELLFTGVLMFLCHLGARRQIQFQFRENVRCQAKFEALFGVEGIPHGDTLNEAFCKLEPDSVSEVVCSMVERLIRQKVLYPRRLLEQYYLLAVDGTGVLTYHERHCEHCLTRKLNNGQTLYYHPVLEAKLVTQDGFAFSLMTEFIENSDPDASKQDCELKAFYRLAARLKARLPLCLLLDGLFAGGPTFSVCEEYGWKYLITLTDEDLPSVHREFEALYRWSQQTQLPRSYQRCVELGEHRQVHQDYRWVNGISYQDTRKVEHWLSVIECTEHVEPPKTQDKEQTAHTQWKWVTNLQLDYRDVPNVANKGARLRWKIENEGFNAQKNGGFQLEHAYTSDENAAKVFYYLMQIAHTLFQLLAKGSLLKNAFPQGMGSLKNLAKAILEAWRNLKIRAETFRKLGNGRFQIRIDCDTC